MMDSAKRVPFTGGRRRDSGSGGAYNAFLLREGLTDPTNIRKPSSTISAAGRSCSGSQNPSTPSLQAVRTGVKESSEPYVVDVFRFLGVASIKTVAVENDEHGGLPLRQSMSAAEAALLDLAAEVGSGACVCRRVGSTDERRDGLLTDADIARTGPSDLLGPVNYFCRSRTPPLNTSSVHRRGFKLVANRKL